MTLDVFMGDKCNVRHVLLHRFESLIEVFKLCFSKQDGILLLGLFEVCIAFALTVFFVDHEGVNGEVSMLCFKAS